MNIPLVVVDPWPPLDDREPGMMWRYEDRDTQDRECWMIVLPSHPDLGTPGHPSILMWWTTQQASDPPHEMWDVVGEPPNITVKPSIDVLRYVTRGGKMVREGSYWHGFITNGFLVS